jgi:hypothetical protein
MWIHIMSIDQQLMCPTWCTWTFPMACSKAKLKSSGVKASPCFRHIINRKIIKYLPIWTLLCVLYKHILISLSSVMHTQNSIKVLYSWIRGSLKVNEWALYCLSVLSFFPPVSDERKKCDQYLICYVETYTDNPQQFNLYIDLTLREGCDVIMS